MIDSRDSFWEFERQERRSVAALLAQLVSYSCESHRPGGTEVGIFKQDAKVETASILSVLTVSFCPVLLSMTDFLKGVPEWTCVSRGGCLLPVGRR